MKQPEAYRHRNHQCSPGTARASHRHDVAFLHPPSLSGELKAHLPSFKHQKPNNDRTGGTLTESGRHLGANLLL